MSTDLFQTLTLGLLVVVILSLFVAVSMLGKIRAQLERRPAEDAAETTSEEPTPARASTGALTGDDEDLAAAGDATGEEQAEPATGQGDGSAGLGDGGSGEDDSERPFERGGRWYFRRAGELLVYEEGTGEWVPAADREAAGERSDVQHHVETVAASNEPAVETEETESEVAPVTEADAGAPVAAEPSTSFAGQPLANAEEAVSTLGDGPEDGGAGVVATSFEEPGGGSVDLEEAAALEEPAPASDSFWKCPSCGAVNGSTATSCRMCFAARP